MLSMLAAAILSTSPVRRAADVARAIGMNVHIEYTDGGYRDLAHVLACLQYVGVSTVRDAAPDPANQGQAGYAALAKAGVRFDLFVNGGAIAPALKRIAELDREAPGSVVSIEGPNEVNNHAHFSFEGETDPHRAGVRYQDALFAAVKADSGLAHLPVLSFTDYPFTPGRSDVQNEHPYPPGDRAPGALLQDAVKVDAARAPDQPIIFTELGFSTSQVEGDVSDIAQARLLLMSILDSVSLGVQRVYVYQLLDAYPDPAGKEHERHFGVFNIDYAPKPAARMLRRLATVLRDGSAKAGVFQPAASHLSVSGGGADLRWLEMEKADGERVLALWRETPVFDPKTHSDLQPASELIDVRLPDAHGAIEVTDPVESTWGRLATGLGLIRVPLGADPVLVRITPAGGASL